MTARPPKGDDRETPPPVTAKQTGSGPMAEAKRVFLREYAAKARAMARVHVASKAPLLDFAERCMLLAHHFDRWAGPVLEHGLIVAARLDDATERAPDLAAYAALVSEAQRLGVRF